MKRITLILITVCFANCLQAQAPTQSTPDGLYWTMRVRVKMDRKTEWERRLPIFMKAYYPQFKYRVMEILTGESTGSYMLAIGPITYKDLETPVDFSKEEALSRSSLPSMDALFESEEVSLWSRVNAASDMKANRKPKYVLAVTSEVVIGTWPEILPGLIKEKDARAKGGSKQDLDIYRPSNSGINNKFLSASFYDKIEDIDVDEKFDEMYDKVHGKGEYAKHRKEFYTNVTKIWSEIRIYRYDLSSN